MFSPYTPVLDYPASMPVRLTAEFCVEDCLECARACEQCAQDCLRGIGLRLMVEYRALLMECADSALRAAQAVAQDSADAPILCWVCAQLCKACVNEFSAYETDAFRRCAAACRRCADSCLEVAEAR